MGSTAGVDSCKVLPEELSEVFLKSLVEAAQSVLDRNSKGLTCDNHECLSCALVGR